MVALALFVLAGLLNLFGVRATTTSGADGPLRVQVEHPQVARPGLAAPFAVTIHRDGDFDGPVEVLVSSDYLAHFDENGLDPEPDSSTNDGQMVTWTWDEVPGDTLVVDLDARIEPGVHWRFEGAVEVRAAEELVHLPIATWIAP